MFNQVLIQKVSQYCLHIENGKEWTSTVVINEKYAAATLHCLPESMQQTGSKVIMCDGNEHQHETEIHGINRMSDYVVFKKTNGTFDCVPDYVYPSLLDQYIVVGFPFGEKKPTVGSGHITSISNGCQGYFYGDSGVWSGFSGGGIFYGRNGALMGIARSTKQYSSELEMISSQVIMGHIEVTGHQPFNA